MEELKVGDIVALNFTMRYEADLVVRTVDGNKVICDYYSSIAGEFRQYEFLREQLNLIRSIEES